MEARIESGLERLVAAAKEHLGGDLRSVVLFGSGAEDALRPTSDVNVILVLAAFRPESVAQLRGDLALLGAAIALRPMFLLESEIPEAAEAFAVKFEDVRRRHRVLFGTDPFAALVIPREASIRRLRQILLNLVLRLRGAYAARADDEETLVRTIADAAGPLRAAAAEILELEGRAAPTPREALRLVAGDPLPALSTAREEGRLPEGQAVPLLLSLIEVAASMRERSSRLT